MHIKEITSNHNTFWTPPSTHIHGGFGGLGGSVLPLSTRVRGFKPGRSRQDFSGRKIPSTSSLRKEVKPSVPCRRFAACKRSLTWRGSRNFRQNYGPILAHTVPHFATRISCVVVDVEAPGGERGNFQTEGGFVDRVSTISLLGCSTSVALAMGPTDKEEEVLTPNLMR